jgi:hypothetical protein
MSILRALASRRPTRPAVTALALVGVTAGALLAGCARGADGTAGPASPDSLVEATTTATPQATPVPSPPAPPRSAAPTPPRATPKISGPAIPPNAKDEITLTGRVEKLDVEGGCLVLRVGSQTYQLLGGDPVVLQPGNEARVTGILRPDLTTVCQVGPVLDVVSSQPA